MFSAGIKEFIADKASDFGHFCRIHLCFPACFYLYLVLHVADIFPESDGDAYVGRDPRSGLVNRTALDSFLVEEFALIHAYFHFPRTRAFQSLSVIPSS